MIKQSLETRAIYMPLEAEKKEDSKSRSVWLSVSSEQPCKRKFTDGANQWVCDEILCHDPDCIDLSRMISGGTVLFAHGRDPLFGLLPIAKILEIKIDQAEHKLRANIEFDDDTRSDDILRKIKKGMINGVSTGYQVTTYESVAEGMTSSNGRFAGACQIATRWTPLEISIEPIPADNTVGIGRCTQNTNDDEVQLRIVKHF